MGQPNRSILLCYNTSCCTFHLLYCCGLYCPPVPQASLWNFVRYNVVGGGDSALYGVEGPTFDLRNGLNNLQLVLPLALALPAVAALGRGGGLDLPAGGGKRAAGGAIGGGAGSGMLRLLACVSPAYVWLAAITALPHKEERFLYVVYPLVSKQLRHCCINTSLLLGWTCGSSNSGRGCMLAWQFFTSAGRKQPWPAPTPRPGTLHLPCPACPQICLAAAASFLALLDLTRRLLGAALPQQLAAAVVRGAAALFLAGTCLLALSRSAALVINYGAPVQIYRHLPEVRQPARRAIQHWQPCPAACRPLPVAAPFLPLSPPHGNISTTRLPACLQVTAPGPAIPVCTGAEWYRFPSSFFLPGPRYRLQFIKSGFTGLLPRQFDSALVRRRRSCRRFRCRRQHC
jgi:alpha-1,2-mannosyltransferase